MKNHIIPAFRTFQSGCGRADGLCHIHKYLKKTSPAALDCNDILRSSIVLVVSSFDLYIHEVFRSETIHRLRHKQKISSLKIPFNSAILDGEDQITFIEECIYKDINYKSFVAPSKLEECLKKLIDDPWSKISKHFGESQSICRSNLKAIVDLRNRIAHEADVNPAFAGIELWPIYREDVERSISFLRKFGESIGFSVSLD
jgi:hypothetical protein